MNELYIGVVACIEALNGQLKCINEILAPNEKKETLKIHILLFDHI